MSPTFSPPRPSWGTATKEDEETDTVLNTMNVRLPEVKNLFMTRRFKNCAGRCEELLQNTIWQNDTQNNVSRIYECYLNFYAGLSYDALARNMPHAASSRVVMLRQAEIKYLAAEASLPQPASTPQVYYDSDDGLTSDDDDTPVSSASPSKRNSMESQGWRYSSYSLNSLLRSDTMNTLNPTNRIVDHYLSLSRVPKPSPLHIRKEKPPVRLSAISFSLPVSPNVSISDDPFSDILRPLSAAIDHPDDFAETASTFCPSEPDIAYSRSGADSPTLPSSPTLAYQSSQPHTPSPQRLQYSPSTSLTSRSSHSSTPSPRVTSSPLLSPPCDPYRERQALHKPYEDRQDHHQERRPARYSTNSQLFAHVLAYNDTLRTFSGMLHAHISGVRNLQSEVPVVTVRIAAAQSSRVDAWREQESAVMREAKRKALVQRALARKRFAPERYAELCQRALSEI